jgi:hypothetical protein
MGIFDTALTIEDGTGIAGADSYIAVADLRQYCANLNYVIDPSVTDAFLETRLRAAANWIDTAFRYKGNKLTTTQSLEFPRVNLLDWSSMAVLGVPLRVAKACAELAYKAIDDVELFQDLERGGLISHEQVGPISTTYDPNAPAQKVYQQAMGFLEQYVRDMDYLIASPVMGGIDDTHPARPTYFHDNMQRDPYTGFGADWTNPIE